MRPTMGELRLIKWNDEHGQVKKLKVIERASDKWKNIGNLFGIDGSVLIDYEGRTQRNSECFSLVLQNWLDNGHTMTYPCTWTGIIEVLADTDHGTLSEDLTNALTHRQS